jgi:GNAT superfamily N-acetyltransferase
MPPPSTTAAFQRLEDVSMAAWPGLKTIMDGPWAVRFGCGYTGRANSINIFHAADDGEARLTRCAALLAAQDVPVLVRLGSFVEAEVTPLLDAAGYAPPHEAVVTLWRPLPAAAPDPRVEIIAGAPSEEWQDAKDRLSGESHETGQARRRLISAITIPTAFAGLRSEDGTYVAVAYVAIHDNCASLNMVVTDPAQRGQRLSEAVCQSLLAWAAGQGATEACLQAKEDNAPALKLYARMGFSQPLYRYHYRRLEQ